MWVSLTRLRIARLSVYPWALLQSIRTARQAARQPGFRDGRILRAQDRVLWTITAWTDETAMKAYRDSASHRTLMPKLITWCDEAALAHWTQPDDAPLPTWPEARARLQAEGRTSRVKAPSEAQKAFRIADLGDAGVSRELPLSIFAPRR